MHAGVQRMHAACMRCTPPSRAPPPTRLADAPGRSFGRLLVDLALDAVMVVSREVDGKKEIDIKK